MNSSDQPDLYAVLDVDPDASSEQLTHAYRALLRRHHPDTRPTAPDVHDHPHLEDARLQQVIHAYTVLRDPAQRARYDREHRPTPPRHREQHRTVPVAAPVVIGTMNQADPAWIAPVDTTPSTNNGLAPSELLEQLLHDLFAPPAEHPDTATLAYTARVSTAATVERGGQRGIRRRGAAVSGVRRTRAPTARPWG
jgi:curved DNA-binding protein CbpA